MADGAHSERPRPERPKLGLAETWRRLNLEQRVAAVGALLLIVSTLGPFTFVEGAIVLIGASVLLLLRRRAEGREFHIPFGDGAVIAAAGAWAGVLILIRIFSRPLGQGLLALVCAAILILAGLRERAKHPADDLPERPAADEPFADLKPRTEAAADRAAYRDETLPLRDDRPAAAGEPDASEEPNAGAETSGAEASRAPRPATPAADRPRPAKVLPPPPSERDLEQPPLWEDRSRKS
jgi:hypothetical protein